MMERSTAPPTQSGTPVPALLLDEAFSPATVALVEALAADLSPLQHAALQRLLDATGHDLYQRADTDAEEIRAGFVAHLARGPEVIWAHVRKGHDALTCPVCAEEERAPRGLSVS